MPLSIPAFLKLLRPNTPPLVCRSSIWMAGCAELMRRSDGVHESGAFLLGRQSQARREISQFLFYDDIDATCFVNGIVEFDGRKLGRVWKYCREHSLRVVADVHVHPAGYAQSSSDQHNPIIPEVGHFALILPYFAKSTVKPGGIGIYEYRGNRRWRDHSLDGKKVFRVT